MKIKFCKTFLLSFFSLLGFLIFTAPAYAGLALWGTNNANSSGFIETVPKGHALTAIGYGSDDHQCIIRIKTAPVNSDGSVDFDNQDTSWQNTACPGGTPGSDRINFEKYFNPSKGNVVTGWNWGAKTSGGGAKDGDPPRECFYQEYMNLATKQVFGWGQEKDGTCNERGYRDFNLKSVARAPAGRVIIGIMFNLGDDAKLDSLSMTTGQALSGWISVNSEDPGVSVTCNAPCNPDIHWRTVVGTDGYVERSNGADAVRFNEASDGDINDSSNLSAGTYTYTLKIADEWSDYYFSKSVIVTVLPFQPPIVPPPGGTPGGTAPATVSYPTIYANNLRGSVPVAGSSATLSWEPVILATQLSGCYAEGAADWSGEKVVKGSQTVTSPNPSVDTSVKYTITCFTPVDNKPIPVSDSVTVNFKAPPPPNPTCTLTSSTNTVGPGQSVTLTASPSGRTIDWYGTDYVPTNSVPTTNIGPVPGQQSETYSYSQLQQGATYTRYFKMHDGPQCAGGQSNPVTVTVTKASSGTGTSSACPPAGNACYNNADKGCFWNGSWCGPPLPPAPQGGASLTAAEGAMQNRQDCDDDGCGPVYQTWGPIESYSNSIVWPAPLTMVGLKLDWGGSAIFFDINQAEFDCTNDGTYEKIVPFDRIYASSASTDGICNYPNPGTYTVYARATKNGQAKSCRGSACEGKATINVISTPIPPSVSLSADRLHYGRNTYGNTGKDTLIWQVTKATSCTGSSNPDTPRSYAYDVWKGEKSVLGGSQYITSTLPASTRFIITCTGPGGTASAYVDINVDGKPPYSPPGGGGGGGGGVPPPSPTPTPPPAPPLAPPPPPPPAPDFGLTSSKDIYLNIVGTSPVTSNSSIISVTPFGGFADRLSLSVSSISPSISGAQFIFGKTSLVSSEYTSGTTFKVTVPANTSAGLYTITIRAGDGGLVRNTSVKLNVQVQEPSFKEI